MGCLSCPNQETNPDSDYVNKIKALSFHNRYRKMHKIKDLRLSKNLCEKAKKKILKLIEKDDDEFIDDEDEDEDEDEECGENLYISYQGKIDVEKIYQYWYDEKNKYDFSKNKYQKGTGHFTQMIWKGTEKVGFEWEESSKNNKFYFLAYYYPAGNEVGKFKENVLVEAKKPQKENSILV